MSGCTLCGADDGETRVRGTVRPAEGLRSGPEVPRVRRRAADRPPGEVPPAADCSTSTRGCAAISSSTSYTEGEDATYVSQLAARERTFDRRAGARSSAWPADADGCSTSARQPGAFVAAAVRRGWDAEGCEPNRWLGEWGARTTGSASGKAACSIRTTRPAASTSSRSGTSSSTRRIRAPCWTDAASC